MSWQSQKQNKNPYKRCLWKMETAESRLAFKEADAKVAKFPPDR